VKATLTTSVTSKKTLVSFKHARKSKASVTYYARGKFPSLLPSSKINNGMAMAVFHTDENANTQKNMNRNKILSRTTL